MRFPVVEIGGIQAEIRRPLFYGKFIFLKIYKVICLTVSIAKQIKATIETDLGKIFFFISPNQSCS